MKRFIAITIFLILISLGMFYYISLPHKISDITAVNGLLDLRGENLSDKLFTLDGEWEFYHSRLYSPKDFSSGEPAGKAYIPAPYAWDSAGYPVHGYATYRLTILTDAPSLLMLIPEIQGAATLWLNGNEVFKAGVVGRSREQTVTRLRNAFVSVHPENGRVEAVLQTSNYRWRYSGIYSSIHIGEAEVLLSDAILRRVLLAIVLGIFLAMGFYHVMLFLYHRKERAYLAFALVCIFAAVRFFLEINGIAELMLKDGIGDGLIVVLMESTILHVLAVTVFVHSIFEIPVTKIKASVYFVLFLIPLLIPFTLLPRFLYFLVLIPMGWAAVSAGRTGKMQENPYTVLFFGSMIFFLVWNPFNTFILKQSLYMPGILINLFLILSQCVMLSVGYAETKRNEQVLARRNEVLDLINQTKTQFLQDMRHEMKNPLTVIATGIDYSDSQITKDSENYTEVRDALGIVRDETQRLGRMVESMATLASMGEQSANRQRVDFSSLLYQSAEAFRKLTAAGVELNTVIDNGMPDVFIERDRFVQVLSNLFANSVEHTAVGSITLSAGFDKQFINVKVTDTGTGIPTTLLPSVFERGVSGGGGTGYGLFFCRMIVEAHGGTINIDSKPGESTSVTFTVPVYGGQEAGH